VETNYIKKNGICNICILCASREWRRRILHRYLGSLKCMYVHISVLCNISDEKKSLKNIEETEGM